MCYGLVVSAVVLFYMQIGNYLDVGYAILSSHALWWVCGRPIYLHFSIDQSWPSGSMAFWVDVIFLSIFVETLCATAFSSREAEEIIAMPHRRVTCRDASPANHASPLFKRCTPPFDRLCPPRRTSGALKATRNTFLWKQVRENAATRVWPGLFVGPLRPRPLNSEGRIWCTSAESAQTHAFGIPSHIWHSGCGRCVLGARGSLWARVSCTANTFVPSKFSFTPTPLIPPVPTLAAAYSRAVFNVPRFVEENDATTVPKTGCRQ